MFGGRAAHSVYFLPMAAALVRQLDAYDSAALDAASVREGGALAGEVEVMVDLGVAMFEVIAAMVERDNARAATAGGGPMPEPLARGYLDAYRRLGATFDRTDTLLRRAQALGHDVVNASAFHAARLELRSLLSLDYDRVVAATAGGPRRSSAEVRDALRRKLAASR